MFRAGAAFRPQRTFVRLSCAGPSAKPGASAVARKTRFWVGPASRYTLNGWPRRGGMAGQQVRHPASFASLKSSCWDGVPRCCRRRVAACRLAAGAAAAMAALAHPPLGCTWTTWCGTRCAALDVPRACFGHFRPPTGVGMAEAGGGRLAAAWPRNLRRSPYVLWTRLATGQGSIAQGYTAPGRHRALGAGRGPSVTVAVCTRIPPRV